MAKNKHPALLVTVDAEEGYAAAGYIGGITKEIRSKYYLNDVVTFTHSKMASGFNLHMVGLSQSKPWSYHHVWEPGHVGQPGFELWRHMIFGKGDNKEATWEWVASRIQILSPKDRKLKNDWDVIQKVPDEIIDKLKMSNSLRYHFVWKAPVMEYRLRATVQPVNTKFLFIPLNKKKGLRGSKKNKFGRQNFEFSKYNVPDWDYSNPQDSSGPIDGRGKGGTVNKFTSAWVSYWNSGLADDVWETQVAPIINNDIQSAEFDMYARIKSRPSRGVVSLKTAAKQRDAFDIASNFARAFIRGHAKSYAKIARYVERNGYFPGELEY